MLAFLDVVRARHGQGTAGLPLPILINPFPRLHDNLAEALGPGYPRDNAVTSNTVACEHGERARLTDYSYQAVIAECQLLKWTMSDMLEQHGVSLDAGASAWPPDAGPWIATTRWECSERPRQRCGPAPPEPGTRSACCWFHKKWLNCRECKPSMPAFFFWKNLPATLAAPVFCRSWPRLPQLAGDTKRTSCLRWRKQVLSFDKAARQRTGNYPPAMPDQQA